MTLKILPNHASYKFSMKVPACDAPDVSYWPIFSLLACL